ncbi:hypothetical protein HA402_011883 [Bradysia odoriphaga]|nr:hypothetical protein HA402_011883 [Bradysia odoriphaga]
MNSLPNELLLKILSYLPNNKSIALVSRRFYDAVCTLDAKDVRLIVYGRVRNNSTFREFYNKIYVFLQEPKEKNDRFIRSVMNTTRSIRNIMVNFASVEREVVIGILKKFTKNIDYLRVCAENGSDYLEAIELVPNVVHLELVSLACCDYVPSIKKARHGDENNKVLNLLRLRKLQMERCVNLDVVEMFNRLPDDLLLELSLLASDLSRSCVLFRKQRNITKLTITRCRCDWVCNHKEMIIRDASIFDHLKLEFLEWQADKFEDANIRSVLAKQNNLQSLRLVAMEVNVDLLNVITDQLRKLHTLEIGITNLPTDAVIKIAKLENLTDLTLWSDDEDSAEVFRELAKLDNSRITALNIQHCFDIPDDVIAELSRSLPNLKRITVHCVFNINTFSAILKHFNYVEAVHLDAADIHWEAKDRTGYCESLMKRGCNNDKLTELRIPYPIAYSMNMVEKMVAYYPHLKRLVFFPTNRLFYDPFVGILKGFKELESLFILRSLCDVKKRHYDLNLIIEHGINLKFVALLDLELVGHDVLMIGESVRKKFGFIQYDRKLGVKMAVDRRIMKTEWEYVMTNTNWEYIRPY